MDLTKVRFVSDRCLYPELREPDFTKWAFGSTDLSTRLESTPAMWNALHADLFICDGHCEVRESLNRMYNFYKKAKL